MLSGASFRVLDAGLPAERAEWVDAWTAWPAREVFAHPAYVELYAAPGDRALCAVLRDGEAGIVHPFILRGLEHEPYAAAAGVGRAGDVVSPYGYGGPYAWGGDGDGARAAWFWAQLGAWSVRAGVVAEFVRFPLWDGPASAYPGTRTEKLVNVVRTLDSSMDEMWMEFEHKVRKNVKKALRSGVSVQVDPAGERLEDFLRIYGETMRRREASASYDFPRAFFESIANGLPGQFCYFHALVGGNVVSTELVLVSEENVYSFLGGTDQGAFDLRPNDLLKHEIIAWAKAQGKRRFVLGGGYQPGDGIFRYKLAFAPHGEVPYTVGTRIVRPDAYDALVRARAELAGPGWEPTPGFFPAYRSEGQVRPVEESVPCVA